ncbi:hypothetical protein ACSNOB_22810 [Micromonospora sp. URMC 106]|uniref:hypothetical protein n=1 Tax=Micromonospora sp. URMC 106 TaxID=3423408 RepID=UPI003F1A8DBE
MGAGTRARAVAVAAAIGLVAGCGGGPPREAQGCRKSVREAEAKVRADRWDPPEELPDLGDYPEIHWQARALGDPCSRVPGPTDWAYQGVVRLHPQDARRLAERYDFVPLAAGAPAHLGQGKTPADVWPGLQPFVPAGARWLHSRSYDEAPPATRGRVAFLDAEHRTVLFMLNDH